MGSRAEAVQPLKLATPPLDERSKYLRRLVVRALAGVERLQRDEPLVGEQDVERDAAVALAQDHAIAAWPFGLARTVTQHIVIKDPHDLDERHG